MHKEDQRFLLPYFLLLEEISQNYMKLGEKVNALFAEIS
jgi:hypothetical protein